MDNLSAFRIGDVRGLYPQDINEAFAQSFAHAFIGTFDLGKKIAVGRDMRDSSESLHGALTETLASIGMEVLDIGLCPTEVGYFASSLTGVEAAIVVTASHNPPQYNGLKCVLHGGQAVTEFDAITQLMQQGYQHPDGSGSITQVDAHSQYLEFLKQHFPPEMLHEEAVALNGLNGTAATMAELIAKDFELPATWFRKDPGPIPIEGADPTHPTLVEEMKTFMADASFHLGVAWDGDCDRCVFFDEDGDLVPTYYMVGFLAEYFLSRNPGSGIVFDTKLCWNTLDVIEKSKGKAIPSRTGHAFMKEQMHEHGAIYGGELSSHHYFGDFFGCDSGMFAWLTVLKLLNERHHSIKSMVEERRQKFCCTPEISFALNDTDKAFQSMIHLYQDRTEIDQLDGLAFSTPGEWRFSLRRSKTEPVVRVNFEATHADMLLNEASEVLESLRPFQADRVDAQSMLRIL